MKKILGVMFLSFMMVILFGCNNKKDATTTTNAEQREVFIDIDAGEQHTIALTEDGHVYTWGDNLYGQLGNGTNGADKFETTPVDITQNFTLTDNEIITEVISGPAYNFAITSNNRIFAWGYNLHGELGSGSTGIENSPIDITAQFNLNTGEEITTITASYHNFAMTSVGRILGWGYNGGLDEVSRLGNGNYDIVLTPTDLTSQFNLDNSEKIVDIVYNMALTSSNHILAWGLNDEGQVGDGTNTNHDMPIDVTDNILNMSYCVLNEDDEGCFNNEYLELNLNEDETIIDIVEDNPRNLLITSTGRVFGFGVRIGHSTTTETFLVERTQSFNLDNQEHITQIASGSIHNVFLTSNGRLLTYGLNNDGQLGVEDIEGAAIPIDITESFNLDENETIVKVSCGLKHTNVLTSNGRIFTWGLNGKGQLGNGSTTTQSVPIEITFNE